MGAHEPAQKITVGQPFAWEGKTPPYGIWDLRGILYQAWPGKLQHSLIAREPSHPAEFTFKHSSRCVKSEDRMIPPILRRLICIVEYILLVKGLGNGQRKGRKGRNRSDFVGLNPDRAVTSPEKWFPYRVGC